jgi:hypothetical protein
MLSKLKRPLGGKDCHSVVFYRTRISGENAFYTRVDKHRYSYLWGVIQSGHLAVAW